MNHEAMFWEYEDDKIRCKLCPQYCLIKEGHLGLCQTRKHEDKKLIAINYGELTSVALDPIEKKPLYHFKPGHHVLSVGTFGCNMKCSFCQNHEISQVRAKSDFVDSDELLKLIDQVEDNIGIAFTYNEPLMWFEYLYDGAKKIKEKNPRKKIVVVTNGYINREPLEKLLPYVDAMNIDLKAFTTSFYQKVCKASLEPVLKTIEKAHRACHVEVTTLMVTGENDSIEEIESIAKFLGNIDKDIPLHLTRYYPMYKMKHKATDVNQMKQAKKIALKYLNYVYLGNTEVDDKNTYCPSCQSLIINRDLKTITNIKNQHCLKCGEKIPIIL